MKYIVLTLLAGYLLAEQSYGSDLVFFSEAGESFTLHVNGKKINNKPAPRVEATEVFVDFAQIKIEFESSEARELKSSMALEPEKLITSVIKKNKKGKYVIRLVSITDLISRPVADESLSPGMTTEISPSAREQQELPDEPGSLLDIGVGEKGGLQIKVGQPDWENMEDNHSQEAQPPTKLVSSRATVQLTARVEGNNILLSDGRSYQFKYVKMNNFGARMEILNPVGALASISYDDIEAYKGEIPFLYDEKDWKKGNAYFKLTVNEPNATWSVKLKYSNGNKMIIDGSSVSHQGQPMGRCQGAMTTGSYNRALASINGKSFAEDKMTVFNQVIRGNCLSTSQVVGIMKAFTYEEDKVAVAKKAYERTIDQDNYYQVNDALTYEDSMAELARFLEEN